MRLRGAFVLAATLLATLARADSPALPLDREPAQAAELRALRGEALEEALRGVLASDRLDPIGWPQYVGELFTIVDHLRPALRRALADAHLFAQAMRLLRYSANARDLELAVRLVSQRPVLVVDHAMTEVDRRRGLPVLEKHADPDVVSARGDLAGALVAPTNEAQWRFLTEALAGSWDESGAAGEAAHALRLNGSKRALGILKATERGPPFEARDEAMEALPIVVAGARRRLLPSIEAAATLFERTKSWTAKVSSSWVDESGTRSLVSVVLMPDDEHGCAQGYAVLLTKAKNGWRVAGMWLEYVT